MTTSLLLELTRRHQEPHRHYHSLEHIAGMLHAGRAFPLDDLQTMAVWFHDAIYDPHSRTNEEDSAELAGERLLAAGWERGRVEVVQRIVLDTKRHEPSLPESAPVLDLDLMSLALPWPEFTRNTENIRREYSHVPDAEFAAGRRAFFATMLLRERLFYTPFGQALEATARANLRRASEGA
jgi:predicted metal-dependent HD superfamily phosphohydrolase